MAYPLPVITLGGLCLCQIVSTNNFPPHDWDRLGSTRTVCIARGRRCTCGIPSTCSGNPCRQAVRMRRSAHENSALWEIRSRWCREDAAPAPSIVRACSCARIATMWRPSPPSWRDGRSGGKGLSLAKLIRRPLYRLVWGMRLPVMGMCGLSTHTPVRTPYLPTEDGPYPYMVRGRQDA